ncbi:uncharacterized protein LOC100827544 [Brachypodium distachyon]|uniref:RRM domain-containing protein n=2 Tax=Brachypodium distachyon TaxID=15368 RepID=A0A0Q3HBD8_BRADI|nr:uncharacterized protein LOC100827544 [Brachypodium distachyon]KQK20224.1 hypothetical protein BRADI_1g53190v3 [Brachypodium distachyon]|eukprot:XP_010228188.1 uncharacterized protein LOC100827544 [Brachypodium distachyon]
MLSIGKKKGTPTSRARAAAKRRSIPCAKENQAAESSKDTDDKKVERPWNIIRIRLPPRKTLSDASPTLSNKAIQTTDNIRSTEVLELATDIPGKHLITAPEQGEASSNSPRRGLCDDANSETLRTTLSAIYDTYSSGNKLLDEAIDSTLSKNLRTSAREQGSDASSYLADQGLCEEVNNTSMTLPLSAKELPGYHIDNRPSKNLKITGEQVEEEKNISPRKKMLCDTDGKVAHEEGNNPSMTLPLPVKELPGYHIDNRPSKNLKITGEQVEEEKNISPRKNMFCDTDGKVAHEEGNNLSMTLPLPVKELPGYHIDNCLSKNLKITGEQVEEEKNISPRKKMLCDTDGKVAHEEGNNPSWDLKITAVRCEVSDEQSNRLTDLGNKNTPQKRLHTSSVQAISTSQNTSEVKLSTSVGEVVEQSTNAANTEVIKEYHDFEGKVKRTVHFDFVTDEAAQALKNPSRKGATTGVKREVFEHAKDHITTRKLPDVAKNNTPQKRPHTSSVQARSTSVGEVVEQSTNAANMEVIKEYHDFDEKVKQTVHFDNVTHEATQALKNPSRKVATTGVKRVVFEHAKNLITTRKLPDVAKNNAPSNRPTDPARKSTPRKKMRASAVQATDSSQNKSGMKVSTSPGQATDQRKNSADLEAIKEFQEFEERVKRTVYLDNLSHHATEAIIKSSLSQFCTLRKVSFVVNYTIPYNIPQSALVEMETEKDAEVLVSMLHDFPFMMYGMPRPVRAKRATAEMFNDCPRRPGSKFKFHWVGPTDPDSEILKRLKLISRRHEVENLALIEHELEEEKLLAEQQQENLNCNFRMMETMDTVILSGMANYISRIYSINWNEAF